MKRTLALMLFMVLSFALAAQTNYSSLAEKLGAGDPGNRGTTLIACPENTNYSHPINNQTGFTSWTGSQYTVCDQVETDPVSAVAEIVFYGISEGSTPSRNFEIRIYADNAGSPGAVMNSYASFITAVNTGELFYSYPVYSYTYTFPASISLQAGDWISVRADGDNYWYWLTGSGGDGCVYQENYAYRCDYGDVAFCLVGGPATPVSPWAIAIGIGLIATATILRMRRNG